MADRDNLIPETRERVLLNGSAVSTITNNQTGAVVRQDGSNILINLDLWPEQMWYPRRAVSPPIIEVLTTPQRCELSSTHQLGYAFAHNHEASPVAGVPALAVLVTLDDDGDARLRSWLDESDVNYPV